LAEIVIAATKKKNIATYHDTGIQKALPSSLFRFLFVTVGWISNSFITLFSRLGPTEKL